MLSMFKEKDCIIETGKVTTTCWSMTRVVAFLFALSYCGVLITNAANAHQISWPFCALGIVIVLAVPLQALFKYIQVWFTSSPGQKLVKILLEKVALSPTVSSSTTIETKTGAAAEEGVG